MRASGAWRNAFESLFPQELARQDSGVHSSKTWAIVHVDRAGKTCFCSHFAASGCEVHALPLSEHETAVLRWTAVVLDERILSMQHERRAPLLPTPLTLTEVVV